MLILGALFITSVLVANIISVKLWTIGSIILPAGVIAYPLSFLFTDTICELYGKKAGRRAVWAGFISNALMLLLIYVGRILPAAPFWEEGQAAYELIFGNVWRMVLASMVAYLAAQHHDIWAFHWWREKTAGRKLWLRNNLSTMVSQAIDTGVFIPIAFAGLVPLKVLLTMMACQYIWKLGFALADTPFCYAIVWVISKRR